MSRVVVVLLLLPMLACAPADQPTPSPGPVPADPPPTGQATPLETPTTTADRVQLTLMTHESFAVSDEVLATLEREEGITLRILRSGDAGVMVNQAILAGDAPLADILFGVDNTFLSRALEAGIFEAYGSPRLEHVPAALQLDEDQRVTPIDYGDVCLNYDRAAFNEDLPPPAGLDDLTDERYRGMLVVPNPATSSPGLAFLLATVIEHGEGWRDYWAALVANDVLVTSGWSEAYYSHFSASGEGDRPIVLSYATSPAAEVLFAEEQLEEPPTGVVTAGCFRQVEFAGILRGTEHRDAAERAIDFMLGRTFQEDVPLNMFVFPANAEAELPEVFVEHAARIDEPLSMDPAEIDARREQLIEEWTDVVLR
ncbi:MAG TPA: thiamine ABC transporter substrate-binding protein [Candidatus Limnocylindrales bacterium]|nr:thiamine ABC transporter substrate-binding protein [Candidatus Limnocylindrales bacterium]